MTKELRRLAEAATQGEWSAKRWTDKEGDVYGWNFTVNGYLLPLCNLETDNNDECDANAAYIAAANPAAILELLDRLDKAEKDAARLEYLLEHHSYHYSMQPDSPAEHGIEYQWQQGTYEERNYGIRASIDAAMEASK